jgi:peptidoglycan/xylan/chitin deacetylase (PgdA/CDA1 family)/2-polyprenyl-3-methyl-5-hydroxy-6-metoxy-1,4-benzoquinol methylase
MTFTIIIPAFNAADTLGKALDSLLVQSFSQWEAFVVNDGSGDATGVVSTDYAARDRRIRVLNIENRGMTLARNAALPYVEGEWVIFLDADDWLEPDALSHFREGFRADPGAEIICGRWARVAQDGSSREDGFRLVSADLFSVVSRFCPFAIHSCAVRRDVVISAGGFDPAHRLCADWDFWQRLARRGATIAETNARVAAYRMTTGSSITNIEQILEEGLGIIDLGHRADPRVREPDPRFAAGAPSADLVEARLLFLCWQAGLMIGSRADTMRLFNHLRASDRDPELKPAHVAESLHAAIPIAWGVDQDRWAERWITVVDPVKAFLNMLELRAGAPGLARRAMNALERLVLQATPKRPLTIGRRHAVRLEVSRPLPDLPVPEEVEHVICSLLLDGEELGEIELPVFARMVPGILLRDAIVAHHAWPILGGYFARQVYPRLTLETGDGQTRIVRDGLSLAEIDSDPADPAERRFHDAVGWTVFLQELWGLPGWPMPRFYREETEEESPEALPSDPTIVIDVCDPIPSLASETPVTVEWTVGGVSVCVTTTSPTNGVITAQRLRIGVTHQAGIELARAAVREAVLERLLDDGVPLRERLAERARAERAGNQVSDIPGTNLPPETRWTPEAGRAIRRALESHPSGVLARHVHGLPGTSASRRARLPYEARTELEEAARATGEPSISTDETGPVIYAPDLLWIREREDHANPGTSSATAHRLAQEGYDRHYFETVFLADPDPWKYATPFERLKYEQTLSLIPAGKPALALELACAEGAFTRLLAPLVHRLVATDISEVALERAKLRCRDIENVEFRQLDFAADSLPPDFDLIVCSESLYYLKDLAALKELTGRIADALVPGGHCITAHSTAVVDDPAATGLHWDVPFGAKVIGETFAATPGLRLVRELRTPFYRIQLLERTEPVKEAASDPAVEEVPAAELPDHLVSRFLIGGGAVHTGGKPAALTYQLPILLYHQISERGPESLARYRVTPKLFAEQMRYLHRAGFRTVTLEQWLKAMRSYQPLPGRAVIITFDDGYQDFADAAWPVLRQYGFGAYVYLVTERVGQHSSWTETYGGTAPLMDWETISRIRTEGAEFGSHTATHPHLEALSPAEVVKEAARSRATLSRVLGTPVSSIAYPNGSEDRSIQHLAGACGYVFGLSCQTRLSRFTDPPLALPRIEIFGEDSVADFIRKLDRDDAHSG